MLGFDRRAARYTLTAVIVLLSLYLVYLVRSTLFVFSLAILLAYLLAPLVNLTARLLPGNRRTAALALVYAIVIAISVLFLSQIGARAVKQAETLNKRLPDILARWQQPTPAVKPAVNSLKDEVIGKLRLEAARRSGDLFASLPQYGLKILAAASGVIYLAIIPILAFFFLKDAQLIREQLLGFVTHGPYREIATEIMADIQLLLAGYMRALVTLTVVAFAAYGILFTILGVPYGVLLAVVAGMLEFIPTVGPLTASLLVFVLVGVADSHVLAAAIFLPIFRILQDDVISPRLMGKGVQLHPLLVMFGVFAGVKVAGAAGAFLSVPLLALVRILYLRIWKARRAKRAT